MTERAGTGPMQAGVAFATLGCKVNRAESDAIAAELTRMGTPVVDPDDAALIIVNTCTVTAEADAKVRKAVRRALCARRAPRVLVTGCLATLDPAGLRELGDRVIVEPDKERVATVARELLGVSGDVPGAPERVRRPGGRTRAIVKVQDGCDAFCSYCIIPYARGVPRSRPVREVVREVAGLAEAGVREVVVAGVNLGLYSDGGTGLAGLLARLADTGVARVRMSSIEPQHVSDELLAVVCERTDIICPHLHLPLQSGSDAVLKAMAREYTRDAYLATIERVREAIPDVSLTTDIIVGFPGEREKDHRDTLDLLEAVGFASLHVFRFSPRRGTPAASLTPRIDPRIVAARAAEVRALGQRLARRFAAARAGRSVEVLVEVVTDGRATGTTREYLSVSFPADGVRVGDLRRVTLGAEAAVVDG